MVSLGAFDRYASWSVWAYCSVATKGDIPSAMPMMTVSSAHVIPAKIPYPILYAGMNDGFWDLAATSIEACYEPCHDEMLLAGSPYRTLRTGRPYGRRCHEAFGRSPRLLGHVGERAHVSDRLGVCRHELAFAPSGPKCRSFASISSLHANSVLTFSSLLLISSSVPSPGIQIKDKAGVQAVGFRFTCGPAEYEYDYEKKGWRKV